MTKPTNQEVIATLSIDEEPVQAADMMDDFINNMTLDVESFVGEVARADEAVRTRFSRISLLWLTRMDYYHEYKFFDLRNGESVTKAAELCDFLRESLLSLETDTTHIAKKPWLTWFEESVLEVNPILESFEGKFVAQLSRTHRTLQQDFTRIVFSWLFRMGEFTQDPLFQEITVKLNEKYDKDFSRLSSI